MPKPEDAFPQISNIKTILANLIPGTEGSARARLVDIQGLITSLEQDLARAPFKRNKNALLWREQAIKNGRRDWEEVCAEMEDILTGRLKPKTELVLYFQDGTPYSAPELVTEAEYLDEEYLEDLEAEYMIEKHIEDDGESGSEDPEPLIVSLAAEDILK